MRGTDTLLFSQRSELKLQMELAQEILTIEAENPRISKTILIALPNLLPEAVSLTLMDRLDPMHLTYLQIRFA